MARLVLVSLLEVAADMAETERESAHERSNENLLRVTRLTREMLAIADEGDRDRDDRTCGILYGRLRDMAYKLRELAEEECRRHRRSGKWD